MKVNQNFGIALHILVFLSDCKTSYITSNDLATSINTNPVIVRRILKMLADGKLVETKQGKFGSRLLKDASDITLLDVYNIFYTGSILQLVHSPNKECPVGHTILKSVNEILNDATIEFQKQLSLTTILNLKEKVERGI